ncbi:DsbA family protein [Jongsikchunia kroppenstedtii]|uniref:DsbA family protein n=1 Tax=Jongsikchunia kroppenstedtii TaxID=1121721 RepID=UPI00039DA3A3|nr:thioredoxin domain-containing protein [Jongsikchunia kroppenstedtii]
MSNNKVPKKVKPVRAGAKNPRQTSSVVTYVLAGLAIVVVIAVIAIGIVASDKDKSGKSLPQDQLAQTTLYTAVKPGATPAATLDLFEDFQCPACQSFEKQYGEQIVQAINDGKLSVRYHMVNFLDRSGKYSSRAAGAAKAVAAENNLDLYLNFHTKLYDQQPPETNADGLSNEQLAQIAASVGASPATQQTIATQQLDSGNVADAMTLASNSLKQMSDLLGASNVSTPSVVYQGKVYTKYQSDPNWLSELTK